MLSRRDAVLSIYRRGRPLFQRFDVRRLCAEPVPLDASMHANRSVVIIPPDLSLSTAKPVLVRLVVAMLRSMRNVPRATMLAIVLQLPALMNVLAWDVP